MYDSYEKYTNKRAKPRAGRIVTRILKFICLMFVLFVFVQTCFMGTISVQTVCMQPALAEGERVIYSPLSYGALVAGLRLPGMGTPIRGDIVAVTSPEALSMSWLQFLLDPVVRFFTLGQVGAAKDSLGRSADLHQLRRIIGLPGDTVRVENGLIWIKPMNQEEFVREETLAPHPYTPVYDPDTISAKRNEQPDLFEEPVEFSVGDAEYFVVTDDRRIFADSRQHGPVPFSRIAGKVFYRYWPFERCGTP
ncbi:MAG: signal peptidase I [Spirochaetaceae bacterium]|nr:MAG: signal peptidase I [Spirochaetaceae bacterium]